MGYLDLLLFFAGGMLISGFVTWIITYKQAYRKGYRFGFRKGQSKGFSAGLDYNKTYPELKQYGVLNEKFIVS